MCNCLERANEALEKEFPGVRYLSTLPWGGAQPRIILEAYRESGRGKTPRLVASYCPLCGARYDDEPEFPVMCEQEAAPCSS